MATDRGFLTSDDVPMAEVLYGYIIPRDDVWNFEAEIDLKALWTQHHDESYVEWQVNRFIAQELGVAGRPDKSKVIWGKKQRDIRKFGLGIGYFIDWLVRAKRSLADFLAHQESAHRADRELVRTLIIDAILNSANTPYCLLNGAFVALENTANAPQYGQNTFAGSHTHYFTTGTAAFSTLTPITAAKRTLREHGRNGPYVAFCNSETFQDIENMAGWTAAATSPTYNQVLDEIAKDGFRGRLLGIDWYMNEQIPADYIIIIDSSVGNNLMRFIETANEMFRGLLLFASDFGANLVGLPQFRMGVYPAVDLDYIRWANAMVFLRDAACVIQVTTSATYSAPAALWTGILEEH